VTLAGPSGFCGEESNLCYSVWPGTGSHAECLYSAGTQVEGAHSLGTHCAGDHWEGTQWGEPRVTDLE